MQWNVDGIDTHCHLTDPRIFPHLAEEIASARETGVDGWISSAVSLSQIELHRELQISGVQWTAGIHPLSEVSAGLTVDDLIPLCEQRKICAVGEIGLDFRGTNRDEQITLCAQQIDLALQYDLPVVFHVVRAWNEFFDILRRFPRVRGMIHGFTGSAEIVNKLATYELRFSLGSRFPEIRNAHVTLRAILKRGFYTFETDAPDGKPRDIPGEWNHLANYRLIVERIAALMSD